jgi:hypothetical protein
MTALLDKPQPDWTVIQLDVEYVETPAQFLTELTAAVLQTRSLAGLFHKAKSLPGALFKWISGAVEEVGIGETKLKLRDSLTRDDSWQELAEQLLSHLHGYPGWLLLIIDEFPMMISNFLRSDEAEALRFLRWYRAQRISPSAKRLRFLLGGSVNIEPTLEHLASEALLNDLERFRVDPLDQEDAILFVREVLAAEGAIYEEATPEEIVRVVGTGVHFFLHVLMSECLSEARRKGTTVIRDVVAQIYESRVLGPQSRARFSHYQSRIKTHYGPLEEPARIVLAALTHRQPLTVLDVRKFLIEAQHADADFDRLLVLLEGDYYIIREGDTLQFQSKFLRDWWLRNAPGPRKGTGR